MRATALASMLAMAVTLALGSCGEEGIEVETPAHDVAEVADLAGVHVEMHQVPG